MMIERLDAERVDRYSAEMRYWRGRLNAGTGAWADANADLGRAIDSLTPSGSRSLLWPIHAFRAEVLEKLGEASAAGQERARAVALVEEINAGLTAPQQATFLRRPDVSILLERAHTR
jgi:hypothetical protein